MPTQMAAQTGRVSVAASGTWVITMKAAQPQNAPKIIWTTVVMMPFSPPPT